MTVKELSEAVAQQSVYVDCLGMTNTAQLSHDERVASLAEYKTAKARLHMLAEQLLNAMASDTSTTQAAMNTACHAVNTLYRVH